MNRMARVIRSKQADVSIDTVLNLSAFDLDQVLQRRPTFLEPEYPFEQVCLHLKKVAMNLPRRSRPYYVSCPVIRSRQRRDISQLRC